MPLYQHALIIFAALAVLLAAFTIFRAPLKWAFKLLLNTALGFAGLFFLNLAGPWTGVTLGFNLQNALMIGVLGLPGFALLLVLKWMFLV